MQEHQHKRTGKELDDKKKKKVKENQMTSEEATNKLNMFFEKNVATNPGKWSYYKSQAKKKFDVYPSAYANGWAAKQYKAAGGGWKKESVNEVNMAHVYSKDLNTKKFKDLGLYLSNVLDLAPNKDFRLTTNKKLLAINIDKINPKSLQNIKKRFGVDLKQKAKEPIRLRSKSGMGTISHLGMESVYEGKFGKFDTGAGFKGNGMTIYDRNQDKGGDFKNIAHIGEDGKITIYDKNVKKEPKLMQSLNKISQEFKKTFKESVNEGKLSEDYKNSEWEVYVADENGKEKIVKKAKSKRAGVILYNKLINSDNYYEVGMRVVKESVDEGMTKQQADVTLKQLGGNKFIAMTGAKQFSFGKQGLGFRIGKNSKSINYVRVDLKSNDLYDMEFIRIRGTKIKVVKKVTGVYNDQLQKIFTKHTGLYTSL